MNVKATFRAVFLFLLDFLHFFCVGVSTPLRNVFLASRLPASHMSLLLVLLQNKRNLAIKWWIDVS